MNLIYKNRVFFICFAFLLVLLCVAMITVIYFYFFLEINLFKLFTNQPNHGFEGLQSKDWLVIIVAIFFSFLLIASAYLYLFKLGANKHFTEAENHHQATNQLLKTLPKTANQNNKNLQTFHSYITQHYGRFWRSKLKIYCVIGEKNDVNQQLPNLIEQGWQEHDGAVLLWGGEALSPLEQLTYEALHKFHRKAFDAVVWLAPLSQLEQPDVVALVKNHLYQREQQFKLRVPLYIVALYKQDQTFQSAADRSVGVIFPKQFSSQKLKDHLLTALLLKSDVSKNDVLKNGALKNDVLKNQAIKDKLKSLIVPLSALGMQPLIGAYADSAHPENHSALKPDGWLGVAHYLANSGADLLNQSLFDTQPRKHAIYLRGLFFAMQPIANVQTKLDTPNRRSVINYGNTEDDITSIHNLSSNWMPDATWLSIIQTTEDDVTLLGTNWLYQAQLALCIILLTWGLGSVISFTLNRQSIAFMDARMHGFIENKSANKVIADNTLLSFLDLQQDIERLNHQQHSGIPVLFRFGLNRHEQQLNRLWQHYERALLPFLQAGSDEHLRTELNGWLALPPNSPKRLAQQESIYNSLKAYLMLTDSSHSEADFLEQHLTQLWQQQNNISDVIWQSAGFALIKFFTEHLKTHPNWQITRDESLVANVRAILLRQIGSINAETTLYQAILQQASRSYSDLSLDQMTQGTDYRALFSLQIEEGQSAELSGIFTRQAYEEQIQKAIEKAANTRREEIDWVLSDSPETIQSDDTPDALAERLRTRYFTDYSNAWLELLNRLRWRKATSLSDSIDQLILLADPRQSPLIALFNTISFHSQAGVQQVALTDSLINTAQNLFKAEDHAPRIEPVQPINQPIEMVATFTPLLNLISSQAGSQVSNNQLSLQAYITRVTRLRLKLQQAANSANPDETMRALAQTVFQGTSVDLSDTRDYGYLMAETLGGQWSGFGQALFVQPLEQTWQHVLTPTTENLNTHWQQTIMYEWQRAFNGRFPFSNSQNEVSLPLLGQFIRAESGRLEQFFSRQLAGVLQKEGNRWVPNLLNTQGMVFDDEFLRAINQLADIAEIMYLDGDASIPFELLARPSKGIAETHLLIDGQNLHYFNQLPSWQPLTWPGNLLTTGTRLTWNRVQGGMQIYAEHPGVWGFIRLLEQAEIKQLDSSNYRLTFKPKNGIPIVYILRTQFADGPLALLSLKNFQFPKRIFVIENDDTNYSNLENDQTATEPSIYDDIPKSWLTDQPVITQLAVEEQTESDSDADLEDNGLIVKTEQEASDKAPELEYIKAEDTDVDPLTSDTETPELNVNNKSNAESTEKAVPKSRRSTRKLFNGF